MAGPTPGPSIGDLSAMLTDRIADLAAELLPNGYHDRTGPYWRTGDIHDCPPKPFGGSLVVHLGGPYRGWWKDFQTGEKLRDAFDLVAFRLYGGDKRQAADWAKAWLGLSAETEATRAAIARSRKRSAERRRRAEKEHGELRAKRRGWAQALFLEGEQRIRNTPVDRYLKGRGIDLSRLGRQPGALRYHPACTCTNTGTKLPAMLAAITGPEGRFIGVHRTYLEVRADGSVTKAPIGKSAKKILGDHKGGAIRLWRGEVADPDTGELKPGPPHSAIPPGSALTLSEGIEDGLTVAMVRPDRRIWAAITLGNFAHIELPAGLAEVTIASQNEEKPDAAGIFDRVMAALSGRVPRVLDGRPPAGFKDINDHWVAAKAMAAMKERRA